MSTQDTIATVIQEFTRPAVVELLEFQGADCFGETDAESLSATLAIECLEQLLDGSDMEHDGAEAWLTEHPKICWHIAAYKRAPVTSSQISHWAEWHTEMLREAYGEEHGDQDGDDRLSDTDDQELKTRFAGLITWYVGRAHNWHCEQLKTFTLDADDIREVIEKLRPEWLNKGAQAPSNEGL